MLRRPHAHPLRAALDSFTHAWNGLVHTVVHQRNMRIHLVAASLVGFVGSGIPLGLAEKVTLIFCVLLVLFAEILNSALEALVDLATEQLHESARVTKDAAAAGVLVLALGTVVVFAALVVHNWPVVVAHQDRIGRQLALGHPGDRLRGPAGVAPALAAHRGRPALPGGHRAAGASRPGTPPARSSPP